MSDIPQYRTIKEAVEYAVARLVVKTPFFGTLLSQLKLTETKEIRTFATDGIHLFYNPDFALTLKTRELCTGLAECVLYCAMRHPLRRGARIPEKYQAACRFEIDHHMLRNNAEVLDDEKVKAAPWIWPKGFDPSFNEEWVDFVAEQIYNRLPDPPSQDGGKPDDSDDSEESEEEQESSASPDGEDGGDEDEEQDSEESADDGCDDDEGSNAGEGDGEGDDSDGDGDSQGEPTFSEVLDAPVDSQEEIDELSNKWDMAVSQAAAIAQAQGKLPSSLQLFVDKTKPKLPWEYHLKPFVSSFAKDDFSFSKPHLGALASSGGDVILPSVYSDAIGPIAVAVDTSGSIYCMEELLSTFFGELYGIQRDCRPTEMHFFDCDATVHSHRVYHPDDEMDLTVRGGGGTDFCPVFDMIADKNIECECLIYFTDMMGTFPELPPRYPVLWISYSKIDSAPFGTVINAA